MPGLKDVLANKTQYPDNLVWNLEGGTAVTLGQLRGLDAETRAAVTKQEQDLAAVRTQLEAGNGELKRAQLNVANLFTTLTQVKDAIAAGRFDSLPAEVKAMFGNSAPAGSNGGGANDPFAALARLEQDTLMGPVVQVIKLVRDEAKKAQDAVNANIDVQKKMATNYLNGVLEDRYDRVVPADKQDKFPLNDLIKTAVSSNLFTSDSVPDIKRAFKQLTAGDDAAAREAAIRADERKKLEAELATRGGGAGGRDIFIPTPNSFGLDVHNRSGSAPQPFKSLDAAFEAAAKDPDIWKAVDGTVQ